MSITFTPCSISVFTKIPCPLFIKINSYLPRLSCNPAQTRSFCTVEIVLHRLAAVSDFLIDPNSLPFHHTLFDTRLKGTSKKYRTSFFNVLCYNDSNETVMCGFARITDSVKKTDEELISLRQAGYNGLTIGVETGDDAALSFMQKAILHRIF